MSSNEKPEDEKLQKQRTETDAFRASEEFMGILHDEDSFCYKPWQFADYEVCADTLKTTYDEITLWGQQQAMIRPGWKVESNMVYVPNLFSKVNGVHNNIKLYREEINQLVEKKNTLFYKRFPIWKKKVPKHLRKIYNSIIDKQGMIDKNRLLSSEHWRYRHLKPALQEAIASRIVEFCKLPWFWRFKNFKVNLHFSLFERFANYVNYHNNKPALEEKIMKLSTFDVLMHINEEFLNLLQNFDYPLDIPKIIIYNNGKSGTFAYSDALLLMFMNSMGVDIVIYNPGGTSDIENYVIEDCFDVHYLESKVNFLPYKRNSIFYKLFKK